MDDANEQKCASKNIDNDVGVAGGAIGQERQPVVVVHAVATGTAGKCQCECDKKKKPIPQNKVCKNLLTMQCKTGGHHVCRVQNTRTINFADAK